MTRATPAEAAAAPAAPADLWAALARVREGAPLVQNITNYVVMNTTANALLAVGASPAMVHSVEEVEDFAAISRALVINIGTLSPVWVEAMELAVARARTADIPWVLDPVGAGATRYRTDVATVLARAHPAVIRGNASEVLVLAAESARGVAGTPAGAGEAGKGEAGKEAGKGVDSAHATDAALEPARALARATGALVAMTGATDYVTDGTRTVAIRNGHPMMARVTGLGCTATALVGAFLGVSDLGDATARFDATVAALAVLGVAGEVAAERSPGPGSLQLHLLDALYALDEATLAARARITVVA